MLAEVGYLTGWLHGPVVLARARGGEWPGLREAIEIQPRLGLVRPQLGPTTCIWQLYTRGLWINNYRQHRHHCADRLSGPLLMVRLRTPRRNGEPGEPPPQPPIERRRTGVHGS